MKRAVFAGLAGAALAATPVLAADMPLKAPPPVVSLYNWTGCYVGTTVGGKWGESNQTSATTGGTAVVPWSDNVTVVNTTTGPVTLTPVTGVNGHGAGPFPVGTTIVGPFSVTNNNPIGTNITGRAIKIGGVIGGGEVGCQYHGGNFLIGFEGDGSWTSAKGDAPEVGGFGTRVNSTAFVVTGTPTAPVVTPTTGTISGWIASAKETWLATARARIGFTFAENRGLFFITGGAAWASITAGEVNIGGTNQIPPGVPLFGSSQTRTKLGWTVGAGLEWVLLGPLTGKLEYLYVDLGTTHFFVLATDPFLPRDVTFRQHIARIGVNYRFTPGYGY